MRNKIILFLVAFFLVSTITHADDLTTLTPDGEVTIGSDTISGVEYPRYKLIFGPDGTNSGDVSSSNPLPITLPSSATNVPRAEDSAFANGDPLMPSGAVYRSSTAQSAGTTGDVSELNNDADGRLYVNDQGAGVADQFNSCSATATGTSNTAIKGAVSAKRIYVTDIECVNTADVSSEIQIKDGTTYIWGGYVTRSTVGPSSWSRSFKVPLRGSVNTAFQFQMSNPSTSTTCCATGYTSAN